MNGRGIEVKTFSTFSRAAGKDFVRFISSGERDTQSIIDLAISGTRST